MSFYQPIAPAGSNTQIQYNKNGGFGGDADLTWDDTGKELGVGGDINLDDGGTYTTTLQMVTPTADRTISFPDATGTVALVAGSNGQLTYNSSGAQAGLTSANIGSTGEINISLAGAASTPPVSFTGSWFTGGTATTTKPQLLIEPTGTTSTAWSTSGTGLGVNAASGFSGRLLDLQTNGTSRMVVQGDGKLLVGTSSSPSAGAGQYAKLVVQGYTGGTPGGGVVSIQRDEAATAMSAGDSLGAVHFTDSTGNTFASVKAAVDATAGSGDYPGRLEFSTTADGASSPTERMRIKQSGEIWFNTTTGTIDSSNYGVKLQNNGVIRLSANVTNTQVVLQAFGGTGEFKVLGDGDCENTNNSYSGISDIKLKENIVDANSQWDDLKALQVRNYNFKAETGFNTHTQIGLIAQEVELVSPGLVGESIDDETGESTKNVNYSVLYMKAVKALQEAMERIETLEQRLSDAGIA